METMESAMSYKYECPSCKVAMSTNLSLSTPPVHKCQKKANRVVPLTLIEDKEKTPTE